MRITEHVYLLTGAGYGHCGNAYAILNNNEVILIDTGKEEDALQTMLRTMQYWGLDQYPVTHVLLTHMHFDHTGNAWYFQEHGAKLAISKEDASGMEEGGVRVNDWGLIPYKKCKADILLEDEQVLRFGDLEIRALLMPGHTNGSMFFLFEADGKKMCCTGDTVMPAYGIYDNGFDAFFGDLTTYETNPERYYASLKKAASLRFDILLGGHGIPLMEDGDRVLKMGLRKGVATFIQGRGQ